MNVLDASVKCLKRSHAMPTDGLSGTNVYVYHITTTGKFELRVTLHQADAEDKLVRFRAKSLTELIALSAASFSEDIRAQIRNDVYDAEDILARDEEFAALEARINRVQKTLEARIESSASGETPPCRNPNTCPCRRGSAGKEK